MLFGMLQSSLEKSPVVIFNQQDIFDSKMPSSHCYIVLSNVLQMFADHLYIFVHFAAACGHPRSGLAHTLLT